MIHVNDVPQDDAHVNVMFPSVMRVDGILQSPRGRYYMWFGGHGHDRVRLATAPNPWGPWTVRSPTDLTIDRVEAIHGSIGSSRHLGSPDVHWDGTRFVMMFHARAPAPWGHREGIAWSSDGEAWSFHSLPVVATAGVAGGGTYLRAFFVGSALYGIDQAGELYKADSDDFFSTFPTPSTWTRVTSVGNWNGDASPGPNGETIRHVGLLDLGSDTWRMFYTERGGDPYERVMYADFDTSGDWQTWTLTNRTEFVTVTKWWEGAFETPTSAQLPGALDMPEHALRDPYPFVDGAKQYLYYCGAGEHWITLGELTA